MNKRRQQLHNEIIKLKDSDVEEVLRYVAFLNNDYKKIGDLVWTRPYYPTDDELKEFEQSRKEISEGKFYTLEDLESIVGNEDDDK